MPLLDGRTFEGTFEGSARASAAELRIGNPEDPTVRRSVERVVACHRVEAAAAKARGARRAR